MPYTDYYEQLSTAQSIAHATNTTAVDSEDHLDFGVADPDLGEGMEVRITVTTAFTQATASSHYFTLSDSSDDSTFRIIARSRQIVGTEFTDGAVFRILVPSKVQRYLKATLVKASTITAGVVDIALVPQGA